MSVFNEKAKRKRSQAGWWLELYPHIRERADAVIRLGSMMRCSLNVSFRPGGRMSDRLCKKKTNTATDQ